MLVFGVPLLVLSIRGGRLLVVTSMRLPRSGVHVCQALGIVSFTLSFCIIPSDTVMSVSFKPDFLWFGLSLLVAWTFSQCESRLLPFSIFIFMVLHPG